MNIQKLCLVLVALITIAGVIDAHVANAQSADRAVVKIATFDVDATPPLGSAMAYDPVKRLDELTLRCRGIVLIGSEKPIVLCAVDWIGIANEGHDAFRDGLAEAAGTTRDRVAVHTLHQHDAPGCDFTAERIIQELGIADYGRYEGTFHRQVIKRAAEAIRAALPAAQTVTHYGWGAAEVKEVASNRRIKGPDGRVRVTRYTATRVIPAIRAEPEGVIDPQVSLVSFWNEDRPLAVLSYYACHPQSYYRTGVPSPDFPGIARFVRGQAVPEALHVHFNGAGGNIGAGKYNDGAKGNRMTLALRLAEGMKQAWIATQKHPLTASDIGWQTEPVRLPIAPHLKEAELVKGLKSEPARGYIAKADQLAWLKRCESGHAIDIACLRLGQSRVLHLPGELFVEYQLAAKAMRPDLHVSMAAYGDYGPGYIGTKVAYPEGGYETSPGASNVSPEVEEVLTAAVRKLLGAEPQANVNKPSAGDSAASKTAEAEKEVLLTVPEARTQSRMLHDTYDSILRAMHRRYFRDDGKVPVPSRVLDEVFADLGYRSNIKARWIAVNAQAMSVEHEPKDEFEKQAARQLASGKEEFESVENGVYRRAGAITLFTSCVKCHAPAPMRQEVHRLAGLVISMPVKKE